MHPDQWANHLCKVDNQGLWVSQVDLPLVVLDQVACLPTRWEDQVDPLQEVLDLAVLPPTTTQETCSATHSVDSETENVILTLHLKKWAGSFSLLDLPGEKGNSILRKTLLSKISECVQPEARKKGCVG